MLCTSNSLQFRNKKFEFLVILTAGVRQSMATGGALIGSTGAAAVFAFSGQNYILTFAAASIPPAVALLWLLSVRIYKDLNRFFENYS